MIGLVAQHKDFPLISSSLTLKKSLKLSAECCCWKPRRFRRVFCFSLNIDSWCARCHTLYFIFCCKRANSIASRRPVRVCVHANLNDSLMKPQCENNHWSHSPTPPPTWSVDVHYNSPLSSRNDSIAHTEALSNRQKLISNFIKLLSASSSMRFKGDFVWRLFRTIDWPFCKRWKFAHQRVAVLMRWWYEEDMNYCCKNCFKLRQTMSIFEP